MNNDKQNLILKFLEENPKNKIQLKAIFDIRDKIKQVQNERNEEKRKMIEKMKEKNKILEEIKRKKDVKSELIRQKNNLENNKLLLMKENIFQM